MKLRAGPLKDNKNDKPLARMMKENRRLKSENKRRYSRHHRNTKVYSRILWEEKNGIDVRSEEWASPIFKNKRSILFLFKDTVPGK